MYTPWKVIAQGWFKQELLYPNEGKSVGLVKELRGSYLPSTTVLKGHPLARPKGELYKKKQRGEGEDLSLQIFLYAMEDYQW